LHGVGDFSLTFWRHLITVRPAADLSKRFTDSSQKLFA
jgi:hypothetical protein